MIIDSLLKAEEYNPLHSLFAKAFDFVKSQNLKEIQPGTYSIDGEKLYAIVSEKPGLEKSDAKFEAHDHYIDIQVCITGKETMGWKPRSKCADVLLPYNIENDVILFKDEADMYFQLQEGQFAIFYPEDAHAPMVGEGLIKKMVMKLRL